MSVTPGRFSEFMVKGAETEPEDVNPVWDQVKGIEQTHSIPSAADLTTPTPSPQSNQQSITPDAPNLSPLIEGASTDAVDVNPGTVIKSWDGSSALTVTLPKSLHIRSIWFMRAAGQQISIYAGGNTNGAQLTAVPLTGQASEVINIPDGNTTITLVAAGAFSQPIGVLLTADVLPLLKVNETGYPDGAIPFQINWTASQWTTSSHSNSFATPPLAAGVSLYLSKLLILGLERQNLAYTLAFADPSAFVVAEYNFNSGKDQNTDFVPPLTIRGSKHQGSWTISLTAAYGAFDPIVGNLNFDAILQGYYL